MYVVIRIGSERAMLELTGSAHVVRRLVNIALNDSFHFNKDFGIMRHAIKVMFYDTNVLVSY